MTDTTTVNKSMDLSALCRRFARSPDQICRYAMEYSRYVSADTIEFDIDGFTISKRGKGRQARYCIR